MSILEELKPRFVAEEFKVKAYASDMELFKKFVAYLNQSLPNATGSYLEEDIFSSLVKALHGVEDFRRYCDEGEVKKRLKKKKTELNQECGSN